MNRFSMKSTFLISGEGIKMESLNDCKFQWENHLLDPEKLGFQFYDSFQECDSMIWNEMISNRTWLPQDPHHDNESAQVADWVPIFGLNWWWQPPHISIPSWSKLVHPPCSMPTLPHSRAPPWCRGVPKGYNACAQDSGCVGFRDPDSSTLESWDTPAYQTQTNITWPTIFLPFSVLTIPSWGMSSIFDPYPYRGVLK